MNRGERGRTYIAPRAIIRLAEAAAGSALGIPASAAGVTLRDDAGRLGLAVAAPIPLPSPSPRRAQRRQDGTVIERLSAASTQIRGELQRLSGRRVGRVDIRVTGATLEGRVR